MELKNVEKCPMLNSGRIVRLTRTRSIRCYECEEERGVWWFSCFLQSGEEESQCGWCVGDAWFRVSQISFSLRARVLVCRCRFPSFDLAPQSKNLSFIAFWWRQITCLCNFIKKDRASIPSKTFPASHPRLLLKFWVKPPWPLWNIHILAILSWWNFWWSWLRSIAVEVDVVNLSRFVCNYLFISSSASVTPVVVWSVVL